MKLTALLGALALAVFVAEAADKPASKPAATPTTKPASLFPDEVIAKGKGIEIKRSMLDEAFIALKANAAAQSQVIPEGQRPMLEARLLERLIITQVLTNKATVPDNRRDEHAQRQHHLHRGIDFLDAHGAGAKNSPGPCVNESRRMEPQIISRR